MTDATAQALAGSEPVQSTDPDAEYSAVWDRMEADEAEDAPQEAPEQPEDGAQQPQEAADEQPEGDEAQEGEEAAEDPAQEAAEPAPSDLPSSIKADWDKLSPEARKDLVDRQRSMSQKLSDMGRQVQGIGPIRDVLQEAVRQNPELANMTPQQVAQDVMELSKLSAAFERDRVGTLMGYIKQHGIEKQMSAALQGQPAPEGAQQVQALQKQVRQLEGQLKQALDPNQQRQQFESWSTEAQAATMVNDFASKAEHWDKVEPHMPAFIQVAQQQLGQGASNEDVLKSAYDMATSAIGAKATAPAAPQAAQAQNPDRTEAVKRAKSANVSGSRSGKAREMTEDEALSAAYDRVARS